MWFSSGRSRLGCSNTNGIPSTPSQKSIELCLSAPTRVMWWTAWLWSTRMSVIYQLRLVVAPFQRAERDQLDLRLNDEHRADPLTNRLREARVVGGLLSDLDDQRQRRVLLDARRRWVHADVAADLRAELVDDLPQRRREHVDAAHDQHVVGATDAADARAGAPARARARAQLHVVARAEAQQRRGAVAQVGQHELAARAVAERDRLGGVGVDQFGVHKPARAEVHSVLVLAFSPQGDADVADAHRFGH